MVQGMAERTRNLSPQTRWLWENMIEADKTVSGMKRVGIELRWLLEHENQKSPKELVDTVLIMSDLKAPVLH